MTEPALRIAPEPDDFSDLRAQLGASASQATKLGPWKPQEEGPGSEIAGRVVAVDEVEGNWGKKPVLTLETPEGERTVWASHSVLRSKLEEQPPAPGARILIRYEGTNTSAAGHEYHVYELAVDSTLAVPNGRSWVDIFNAKELTITSPR